MYMLDSLVDQQNYDIARPAPLPLSRLADDDLELMLVIRNFEQALLDLFTRGALNGTTHTCLGQEYIPVALRPLLAEADFIVSNHRGHGHYIARFGDPAGLLAEIMGREGAVCGGVGGSQHLHRAGYLSSGVQGAGVPVAAGIALHLKRAGDAGMAVAYIGDGTWGQGYVYETLNIARLWELPLLVVVEHNQIALSTPCAQGLAGSIAMRARAFDIDYLQITSRDVNQIRAAAAPRIRSARELCAPLVIEFLTSRLGPHSKGDDTRTAAELASTRSVCSGNWPW
jgi:acetoin:2,6-dichlorophenolindophenol oxidoreductase subunit alpha